MRRRSTTMFFKPQNSQKLFKHFARWVIIAAIILSILAGCDSSNILDTSPSDEELAAVDYTPLERDDWEVSTPEGQGLDSDLVAELYYDASQMDTIYSVLVIKDGTLIAEEYFNEGAVDQKTLLQSVSKSYISALVWIADDQGCITGIDARLVDFFPEISEQITDPRKDQITIEQMLQMRSGYPDEETSQEYMDALYWGVYPPLIEDFPLVCEPGTCFNYSNVTYMLLAQVLSRSCEADLRSFAQENLFGPIDTEVGEWHKDREGNYTGSGGIHATSRDVAKFGQLYLDGGEYEGAQIIPSEWVQNSLQSYSEKAKDYGMSLVFKDLGYGYGWWSATVGDHDFNFAWGHGGQLIVLLEDLDMVIVTTADPFFAEHSGNSWKHESAIMNMVGRFIKTLPVE
jgi:CubicO group peptidase (beta-lactamase class C family)